MRLAEVPHLIEQQVPDDTLEVLPVTRSWRDKLRKQAFENAVTLFFLSFCFFITWILLFLFNLGVLPNGQ